MLYLDGLKIIKGSCKQNSNNIEGDRINGYEGSIIDERPMRQGMSLKTRVFKI